MCLIEACKTAASLFFTWQARNTDLEPFMAANTLENEVRSPYSNLTPSTTLLQTPWSQIIFNKIPHVICSLGIWYMRAIYPYLSLSCIPRPLKPRPETGGTLSCQEMKRSSSFRTRHKVQTALEVIFTAYTFPSYSWHWTARSPEASRWFLSVFGTNWAILGIVRLWSA